MNIKFVDTKVKNLCSSAPVWVHASPPGNACVKLVKILCITLLFCSCSSIQAGLYLLFIDNNDGEYFLENEQNVKAFLQNAADLYEQYTIKTFVRTAIYYQIKRTKLITHSYYALICSDGEYSTVSFYGTKISFNSKGVWVLNADSDINSYTMFLEGNNRWDVTEIFQDRSIDVQQTLLNMIDIIDHDINYYYRDHIKKREGSYNCNTALYDTIVFSDTENAE